jgi:diacylglycerol kinase
MCDYINSEYNEKIKIIKDLSSVPIFILVLMFVIFNIYLLI